MMSSIRRGGGSRGRIAAVALLGLTAAISVRGEVRQSVAQMTRQSAPGVLVTFEFDQAAPIMDKVTIVFANASADARKVPSASASFGDGVVRTISFPVRSNSKTTTQASYSTRMPDRSFLDARYIRVVNTGSQPWLVSNISLTVAGQRVLNRVAMYPRKGVDTKGGLAGWNLKAWRPVYWETELFRYTHPAKIY